MTTILNATDRATFAAIADQLVPEAEGMPSASQVGIQDAPLDRVLDLRPELDEDFRRGLRACANADPATAIERLNQADPAALGAIGLVASAAYYMQPRVRALLGYPGQASRPAEPAEEHDYLKDGPRDGPRDGLLQVVIDRGPIYRPTPK